jgi:site-specific DNA-methyltransferase (adenine-specific)
MNNELMFSSKTDNWATPQDFFNKLNEDYNFNLDPCASNKNNKCKFYFTKNDNGLSMDWRIYDFHL